MFFGYKQQKVTLYSLKGEEKRDFGDARRQLTTLKATEKLGSAACGIWVASINGQALEGAGGERHLLQLSPMRFGIRIPRSV